jgi:LuxR family maltose regulon positive regulatory protein
MFYSIAKRGGRSKGWVLTNDLASRDAEDFALVLDDYHLITADPIHRGMTYLLEHLPPQMHLLLATRTDPPSH